MKGKTLEIAFIIVLSASIMLFTANTVQAKKWIVSVNGSDSNIGSEKWPFKTISKGAEMAQPGDTVFVLKGVYRERVAPPRGGEPGKPIVYMAEPGHQVYLKGSDVWKPDWKEEGNGIFYAKPADSLFTDDVYFDDANPFKILVSSTPWGRNGYPEFPERFAAVKYTLGQVFVDGKMWKQVPLKEEMQTEPNTWWYDWHSGNIYLNAGNKGILLNLNIEITTRRRVFAPHKRGLGYIHLIGFIIEHCGNQFPSGFWAIKENAQAGAVGIRQGHHWLIKNNVIRFANSIGIDCGAEGPDNERLEETPDLGHTKIENFSHITGTVIEDNFITDNGSNGIMALGTFNLIIKGNVIVRNNNLHFKGNNRYEQAAIKLHFAKNALIINNYIVDNYSWGIWLDNQWPDTRVTRNFIANNERSGIFLELTDYPFDKAVIDNNILVNNIENAVYAHDASGATFVNNLFANTPGNPDFPEYGQTVFIRQTGLRDMAARTYHYSFYNNIQVGSKCQYSINYPAYLSGEQRFDGNVYDTKETSKTFLINPSSGPTEVFVNDSLFYKVIEDIGDKSLQVSDIKRGKDAQLTFNQWKRFWKKHSAFYDQNSILSATNLVYYDPANFELKLYIDFNPKSVLTYSFPGVDTDYKGNKIQGKVVPGPFQNLKKGINIFKVWDGREPLIDGVHSIYQ